MAENPQRRPFKGSCHCGATRYIAFLTFPHNPPQSRKHGEQSFYRCNCSICHKSGFLHARLNSSPDDFLLLSPLDPFQDMGDYQCDEKLLHFFYCRVCATRCFIFMGEGELIDVDLAELGFGETGIVKAWRPKKDGWQEGKLKHGCYLSVNATSLEPGQEGFDLREWTERKWTAYLDVLRAGEPGAGLPTYERPHPGGSY
ncbi:unnamed protein product [Clonostachys chloroleuca]|uniref:CENP-V/GFA domain-containing protein n=1 Tax=Clonostachys chloroleuca TaxID=1926264 RepID=A0AA35Q2F4_9HYPO|nr:unnamed protein product [Clonostachys chloroleuca]